MDPSKSHDEQFAVWRDAMSPEIDDEEVMALMHKAQQRMTQMAAEKKPKKKVAEGFKNSTKLLTENVLSTLFNKSAPKVATALTPAAAAKNVGAAKSLGAVKTLGAVVGGNHLYHATSAAGLKGILSSGSIRSAAGPQAATVAQTNLPTVSVTRDWGYASGAHAQSQSGEIGRDVILVLDRNAIESNFKTLGTSQSEIVKGLSFNPYITKGGVAKSQNTDQLARANAKAKMKYAAPTVKAGGEFEEAVVVPKGALPLDKTMVGFWVNPKSELMKDPAIMNDPRRLELAPGGTGRFVKANQTLNPAIVANGT
jgi:hypothetical protein